ncbi:T9SS type A sorting domain-containing protein [Flavobacterium silvisoli]|uniref:T9SS type A sorting domain-containing protein n=1 Tax=Flavobacterium silvisoli TaxID=2529433 RepID=A0A4Q9Z018_9FLAO|nr:T9SS type A sorting domain-containing protein [Flavobacterium silvisoli]TBX69535.1 T9SS type A sorting domain-containing protein [Flavobacterium silvisoli]
MKKIYSFLVIALLGFMGQAQIINIPDSNFKAKLLEANTSNYIATTLANAPLKIDTNNDGEIQVSEALTVYKLNVNSSNIADLTGISSFTNLRDLSCAHNQLSGSMNLGSLSNLTAIDFADNQLTGLNIMGLPNLQSISCSQNQITVLNVSGLTNLKYLICFNNQLTALNVNGLTNLIRIESKNNLITSLLLNNLNSLDYADFTNNQLNTLTLSGLPNFHQLFIDNNQLTSLDINGLPNFQNLWCGSNQLTSLSLNNLPNIRVLRCGNNLLTSLNVIALTSLQDLNCYNNQLSSLNVTGLINIQTLTCFGNQLTTLDVNSLKNLQDLYCGDNNLSTLFIKNGRNETTLSFYGNPNLVYVCADETQLATVENLTLGYGYNCVANSYCSFVPGAIFFTLKGNVRYDKDSNGCDASDIPFPNTKIATTYGTESSVLIASYAGNYHCEIPAGTLTATPLLENPTYYNVSPASVSVTFPQATNPTIQDFCITPNGVHNDLEISILPLTNARPGFDSLYKILCTNKGTTTLSGDVNVVFDDTVLDYVSASPNFDAQATNNLTWNFSNLTPCETRIILVTWNLNGQMETPSLHVGDILHFTATINPIANDETPLNNVSILNQKLLSSADPNDKTCIEGTTITPEMVGDYVHYVIRFENTGNANAENIVVKDIIDTTKFDINSLVILSSSASFVTRITNTSKIEFIFENIQLPFDDANNDGYIAFKIKTKPTLVVGDTFSNSANIYFDYNFPIVTNTTETTVAALAVQDFDFGTYFKVYPIPTKQLLNLEVKAAIGVKSISIYNMLGQMVLVVTNAQNVSTIDVSDLKTGTYFIKMDTDKGIADTKFVKE